MEHNSQKEIMVVRGPRWSPLVDTVLLNGVSAGERLTPKMARRAIHVAGGFCEPATAWDREYNFGYRVYTRSARKLHPVP